MDEVVRALAEVADPADAATLARYFQVKPGGYGEGDVFVGVKLSVLRSLARPYCRGDFDPSIWTGLLQSPVHEHRLFTLVVMSVRAGRAGDDELTAIYDLYRDHTDRIDNWDLVDIGAAPVVGGYLMERDRQPLYDLARSPSLWERRIAMVATHHFIRAGQTADAYHLAELLLEDRHHLVHKAVGWMLREAGLRVDQAELRTFLDQHATRMPRTALRYAIERLAPDERRHYLALR